MHVSKIEEIMEFAQKRNHLVCYGAGLYGREILAFFRDRGIEIDAFVVSERQDMAVSLLGIPIYELEDFPLKSDCGWVLSTSPKYHQDIIHSLHLIGVKEYFLVDEILLNEIRNEVISKNKEIKDMARNDRCFILGTGPSIKKQNLQLLSNEEALSCSWCSLLDQYEQISPRYFVSPAFYNDDLGSRYIEESFQFLNKSLISDIIILDYFDRSYVQYYKIFSNKKIYYLFQAGLWNNSSQELYDLTQATPAVQTASIMLLKVALYMGFKKIYLLGTEHNLVNKTFEHAYTHNKHKMSSSYLSNIIFSSIENVVKLPNREILRVSLNMYDEYHCLKQAAESNDIKIYNATKGGDLDEFERVEFDILF